MTSEPTKAVFLSYASQDAEAAKRICDAIRSGGVEVWFDQNELVGGEAWDQKIRTQIRECALLIPVISKTTQARREAYFRLEWKLADERTHLMAKGTPFLLPVTIDETNDRGALVPDSFLAVQWTKAPDGETPPSFCARVKKLLSGSDAGAPPFRQAQGPERVEGLDGARDTSVPDGRRHATPLPKSSRWLVPVIVVGVVIAAGAVWLTRTPAENPVPRNPDSKSPAASAPILTESAQLTARAYAMTQRLSFTFEDLEIAESLVEQAIKLEPDSGRAWSVRAWVQGSHLMRNWDRSPQRLQDTQAFAKRALALSPDDVDALNALAVVMEKQGASSEAEKLARRGLAIDPSNYRSRALLARSLERQDRRAEGRVVLQEAVKLDPGNALAHYELANSYVPFGNSSVIPTEADVKAALEEFDAALAVQPFASALVAKAMLLGGRRGDIPGMLAALDQLEQFPLSERTSERAVFVTLIGGLWAHDPARMHRATALMASDYFEDLTLASPKGWWEALAYRLEGKEALAQMNWSLAETFLRKQLTEQPGNSFLAPQLATTLAWLGKNEEAGRIIAPFEAAVQERDSTWANAMLARYYSAGGDATRTVTYLRPVLNSSVFITDHSLQLDPWWDKVRGQPEFEALLAEAKARIAGARQPGASSPAPVVDAKSVAVLAFANLSDDKSNEYFSDGISEELLNVLAKVPGLKVSARTSAFYFKGKQVPIADIAQQLGVAYVVEGSVRKQGDRVRITAQLIKAADGFHVWSDTFTRDLKDIFAVQDEIAGLVAQQLQLKLGATKTARVVDPEAYQLVLKGRHFWTQRGEANLAIAEEAFRRALEIDPNFAEAHAGIADVWTIRAWYRMMDDGGGPAVTEDLERAMDEVQRATELDPSLAEPYATLGAARYIQGRFDEAEAPFVKAFELNPNYATAHHWYAVYSMGIGRFDVCLEEITLATRLDPLAPIPLWTLASVLNNTGAASEAFDAAVRGLQLRPGFMPLLAEKALAAWSLGRRDEAIAAARTIASDHSDNPRWSADAAAIFVLRQSGHLDEAQQLAERVFATVSAQDYRRALALAALGRMDEAFNLSVNLPNTALYFLVASPIWDPVREDPRFPAMVEALGISEIYREGRATLERMRRQNNPGQ